MLLPLTLKWAEETGQQLVFALGKITCEAARVLNVDAGHLTPGHAADICIFDPERYWKVGLQTLRSQGKNTPYRGVELKGKVRYTLVDGQVVYETR